MKYKGSLFLAIVLLLSMATTHFALGEAEYADPERYETDNLTWEFDEGTGTLSIHGSGPMRSYLEEAPEWEIYGDQILTVRLDDGITSVGECAFYFYGNLQTALLPDSIEVIDQFAFYYCYSLNSITIPTRLRYAGQMCFYNTMLHDPADIVFPEGMEYIGDEAFHSAMKTDGKYVIPSTVRYIGACALSNAMVADIIISEENPFYKSEDHALLTKDGTELLMYSPCAAETSYSVPDGVVRIDAECFNVVQNLEKLSIPASVTQIEDAAIFSTFNLGEIAVAADNPAYKVVDGALCTLDGRTCIAFPDGIKTGEIVIPDGVERIAPNVFLGRFDEELIITLPESLRIIGKLSMPPSISSICIPKGIETIEPYAFWNGGGVNEVIYGGSEADWQSIDIGENNVGLEEAVIRYSE